MRGWERTDEFDQGRERFQVSEPDGGGDGEEASYTFYSCYCELGLVAELKDDNRSGFGRKKN